MSWDTESTTYDPNEFYTRSTDKKGHGETVHVKLPPYMHGVLAELVENPSFPAYRTMADVIRDAVHHRLHYVEEHATDPALVNRLETLAIFERIQNRQQRYQTEVDIANALQNQLQSTFQTGMATRDFTALRAAMADIREEVLNLREPFRSQLLQWIQMATASLPTIGGASQ